MIQNTTRLRTDLYLEYPILQILRSRILKSHTFDKTVLYRTLYVYCKYITTHNLFRVVASKNRTLPSFTREDDIRKICILYFIHINIGIYYTGITYLY